MDLGVEVVADPERPDEISVKPKQETLSFDKGFFVAVKAIQSLRKRINRTLIVAIAGPSGAGKTSLARKIVELIPKSLIISMDNYLDSTHVIDENYDDYRLIDFDLLVKNITEIKNGQSTQLPLYDFRKSGRYAYVTASPPQSKVVIVEGTYALHESVRNLADLSISISGGVHNDLIKRIFRDIQRTGQEPHETIQQITETVYPMFKAFIEPDLQKAQIKIVNNFNPFSGLLNPIYTLKSNKSLSGEDIMRLSGITEPPRVESYYDIYLKPPHPDQSNNSAEENSNWIRMRNNGGTYTLMFSENLKDNEFIISPYLVFSVNVRILGGLMALGYTIGAIIHRKSMIFGTEDLSVSVDSLEELGDSFVQIKGTDRQTVQELGEKLGLTGSYIPKAYIEIYQEKYKQKNSPTNKSHADLLRQHHNSEQLQQFLHAKL
ncbi:Uridine-cytidine kinase C [Balamuthia mandrillaris]